jgi:hypothetical protein
MISHTETIFSGTATESGNTTARYIKTGHDVEAIIYFDITAASGTNPTLDLTLKIYDFVSEKWYELASFNQKTTTGSDVGYIAYGINDRLAAFYTIGGVNPSFTFTVSVNLKDE